MPVHRHRRTAALAVIAAGAGLVAPNAFAGTAELDELWVGGWFSDNVIRVDWKTGALIDEFLAPGAGGLIEAHDFSFGPDRAFYVTSHGNSTIRRYNGETGVFIDTFVPAGNGLNRTHSAFLNRVDDTWLVASELSHLVNQYDRDGLFLGRFVEPREEGLLGPEFIAEGPDGYLYLTAQSNQVLKLDPAKGGVVEKFVWNDPDTEEDDTGGLNWAHGLVFGPDDNLYVASSNNNRVLRYDGETGGFIDSFLAGTPPAFPVGIAFGPDGNLYVAAFATDQIRRYDGATGAALGVAANVGSMGLDGPLGIKFFAGPMCAADLDANGEIDFNDLLAVLAAWGPCPAEEPCPADIDRDDDVDFDDLLTLLGAWGEC